MNANFEIGPYSLYIIVDIVYCDDDYYRYREVM